MNTRDSILIVDDEKESRESLKAILNDHYQVFTTERNQPALDIIEKNNINIVLLSFDASDGEGVKFVEKAKDLKEVLIKQRVQKELEYLRSETKERHSFGQIISKNKKMREIFGMHKGS